MIQIKGYTENELSYLKDNYTRYTNKQLAEQLKKTVGSISQTAHKLGLIKQLHNPWTKEEDEFLTEHYIDMTSVEIGRKLGRTVHSINARRDDLGLVRNAAWTEEDEEYLAENFQNMTHAQMGKYLKRSEQAIRAKCFDLGFYKKELPWTEDELEYLKLNYSELCSKELQENLGRSRVAINIKARKLGLKKYPYYCDYQYFDNIDTEEKAYWLGFMTADGWISENKKNGSGVVGIELSYNDIAHVKEFNKAIKGNYQITDRWRPCSFSDPDKKNHSCVLRIFSKTMYDSLVDKGFDNDKSFTASIPVLPNDLYRHYVRGYFDGNGTICVSNNRLGVRFCTASKQFKDDLIELLKKEDIVLSDYFEVNEFMTEVYYPEAIGRDQQISLLDYMYKDSSIYLPRKYKKYLKAKEKFDTNHECLAL